MSSVRFTTKPRYSRASPRIGLRYHASVILTWNEYEDAFQFLLPPEETVLVSANEDLVAKGRYLGSRTIWTATIKSTASGNHIWQSMFLFRCCPVLSSLPSPSCTVTMSSTMTLHVRFETLQTGGIPLVSYPIPWMSFPDQHGRVEHGLIEAFSISRVQESPVRE